MTTKNDVDTFKHHQLWASADDLIAVASAAVCRTTTDRYTVARALSIAKYVKSFRPIETYLYPANRIAQADAIAGQIDSIRSQLTGWDQAAAMIPQTIAAIDACCEQILVYLGTLNWPSGRRGTDGDGYFAAAESYRLAADQSLMGIAEQISATEARLIELANQATVLADASTERTAEAQESLRTIQALNEVQTTNADRYLDEVLTEVRAKAQTQRLTFSDEAAKHLKSLEENHESGNDLIKMVADQAVGGGYLDFAKAEKRAYGRWNGIAIAAAVVAFVYLVFIFRTDEHTVDGAVLRVGISLTMVALSAYAFREAGKRQRQSVEAHYRALDVLALPPFSKGLSDAQGEQLRYLMGERLFGSHVVAGAQSNKSGDAMNISVDPATVKAVTDAYKAGKAAGLIS